LYNIIPILPFEQDQAIQLFGGLNRNIVPIRLLDILAKSVQNHTFQNADLTVYNGEPGHLLKLEGDHCNPEGGPNGFIQEA
jgi:hypothetical protein